MKHNCPICGKTVFKEYSSFEICEYCGWEDDVIQNSNPNYSGGANTLSLNDYKSRYQEIILKIRIITGVSNKLTIKYVKV